MPKIDFRARKFSDRSSEYDDKNCSFSCLTFPIFSTFIFPFTINAGSGLSYVRDFLLKF